MQLSLALVLPGSLAIIQELDFPPDLVHCYESFDKNTNISATVGETIHHFCLRQFLWKTEHVRWSGFNITQKDMDYINSLIDSVSNFSCSMFSFTWAKQVIIKTN